MGSPVVKAHVLRLNDFIERYEQAQERDGQADPARFLPAPDDPLYLSVLRELVRLDLEYGWQRGAPQPLDEYEQRFPILFRDADSLEEIAFEDYRLRCQAGQQPSAADYQARYGVNTAGWPISTEPPSSRLDPSSQRGRRFDRGHGSRTAEQMAAALSALPEVGTRFLTFRLVAELGRGTFGRVYLAEQADLAGRPVALKVSTDLYDESQALAQLQHTHIVPIHSVHRCPPFQAVCMPYFGSTTLAHVLRDVRGRPTLPSSGRELVSTLGSARADTSTVPGTASPTRHTPAPTPVPIDPLAPTAVQEQSLPRAQLARLTYVEAVLWMGARLADGLAHAHERGILHLDLKPANVLLTDEGQPMLLDFNLAEDIKLRSSVAAVSVGGTLPYMAPEHLEAFDGSNRRLDGRCDVYSLGVILYELLTGQHPFAVHTGDFKEMLLRMRADRLRPSPRLRHWNPAVSPAIESIVRHCLEPRPEGRYQSARELQEDLERQLQQQPLRHAPETLRERARKWLRRNPRLASAGALVAACVVVLFLQLAALSSRGRRLEAYRSADAFRHFREEARTVQFHILSGRTTDRAELDEGVSRCQALLARYRVQDDPAWQQAPAVRALCPEDRRRLGEEVGELLLLWARVTVLRAEGEADERAAAEEGLRLNRRAEECYGGNVPRAVWRQRAELLRLLDREPEAKAAAFRADSVAVTPHDLSMAAAELSFRGLYADALVRLEEATRQDPRSFWSWFDRGLCHEHLGQHAEAAACYDTCIALSPEFAPLYFKRGLAYLAQKKYRPAEGDFDEAIRRRPDLLEAYVNRALARMGEGRHRLAVEDLTHALDRGAAYTRIYFIRARARAALGDQDGAKRDMEEGLSRRPADEQSWLARGAARVARGDAKGALEDFDAALARNPRSLQGLQNKAHVLAEKLGHTEEAVRVLDRLVKLHPDHVHGRASRGVLLARLGKHTEARTDAQDCLKRSDVPATHYQVAGIYALTSRQEPGDRVLALRHLARALRAGYGFDLLDRDPDLVPLRDDAAFRRLVKELRDLP